MVTVDVGAETCAVLAIVKGEVEFSAYAVEAQTNRIAVATCLNTRGKLKLGPSFVSIPEKLPRVCVLSLLQRPGCFIGSYSGLASITFALIYCCFLAFDIVRNIGKCPLSSCLLILGFIKVALCFLLPAFGCGQIHISVADASCIAGGFGRDNIRSSCRDVVLSRLKRSILGRNIALRRGKSALSRALSVALVGKRGSIFGLSNGLITLRTGKIIGRNIGIDKSVLLGLLAKYPPFLLLASKPLHLSAKAFNGVFRCC